MPTRFIQRRAALAPNDISLANANAIFVDSDDDQLKFTTGTSGTTTVDLVTESQTQTLTNKTLTAPTLSGTVAGTYTIGGTPTLTSPIVNSGAAVAATGPEIDNVADVSARLVAGGASLTLTAATHSDRIILLDTAAGTTITLPAATGSGATFRFNVTVTPTSNQHRINVVGNDEFVGVLMVTQDSADTALIFDAADAGDNDQINMNGTTQGGRIGDWVELIDISTDNWHARGVLSGSGIEATPFVTGQVT